MLKRLDNKTIVVTGAASGIGRAVCSLALKEGARVIGVDTCLLYTSDAADE